MAKTEYLEYTTVNDSGTGTRTTYATSPSGGVTAVQEQAWGGKGSKGGNRGLPTAQPPPVITIPTIPPTVAGVDTGTALLVAGGVGLAAYLLWKR